MTTITAATNTLDGPPPQGWGKGTCELEQVKLLEPVSLSNNNAYLEGRLVVHETVIKCWSQTCHPAVAEYMYA